MNCDEFKNATIIGICGKLTADELDAMRSHALECPRCASVYERTRELHGAFAVRDDIPLPDREASWHVIRDRALKNKWRLPALLPARRFAMAAATVAVVFALGILVGRSVFSPGSGRTPPGVDRRYDSVYSVAGYAETVELLLIDFMNRGGQPTSDEMADLTGRVVADMLAQTRLLKRAAVREGDGSLYVLLDDIELVLISISNLGRQNGDVAAQLDHSIRGKLLLTRLRQLLAENATI